MTTNAKGQSCHFTFFARLMVPHGNLSSAVLPVLGDSVGAKKWDRMCASVCVCVVPHTHVVPVLCRLVTQFSGSHPGPIFSFSLHNSRQYHWNCVSCPAFFSFLPPPPPPPPLFLDYFLVFLTPLFYMCRTSKNLTVWYSSLTPWNCD